MAVLAFTTLCALDAHGAVDLEYKLKAEFLERFTRFIDWPDGTFSSAEQSFAVCVVGANPFGDYLQHMAKTRRLKDRPMAVRAIAASDADQCQLVFIARGEPAKPVLLRTSGKPILTVSDTPGYVDAGVLINFYVVDNTVRFEINVAETKKSRLRFSAKLLELGKRAPGSG